MSTTRIVLAACALLGLAVPAHTQSSQDFREIQDALIWTGDYEGMIDGRLGEGTKEAIRKYRSRMRYPNPNGTEFTAEQKASLLAIAGGIRSRDGFKIINDMRSNVAIGIPAGRVALIEQRGPWDANEIASLWRDSSGDIEIATIVSPAADLLALHASVLRKYDHLSPYQAPLRAELIKDSFSVGVDLPSGKYLYMRFVQYKRDINLQGASIRKNEIVGYQLKVNSKLKNPYVGALFNSFEVNRLSGELRDASDAYAICRWGKQPNQTVIDACSKVIEAKSSTSEDVAMASSRRGLLYFEARRDGDAKADFDRALTNQMDLPGIAETLEKLFQRSPDLKPAEISQSATQPTVQSTDSVIVPDKSKVETAVPSIPTNDKSAPTAETAPLRRLGSLLTDITRESLDVMYKAVRK